MVLDGAGWHKAGDLVLSNKIKRKPLQGTASAVLAGTWSTGSTSARPPPCICSTLWRLPVRGIAALGLCRTLWSVTIKLPSLPPYAPELNPVEHWWDELGEKAFGNFVSDSLNALEDQLEGSSPVFSPPVSEKQRNDNYRSVKPRFRIW